MNIYFYMNPEIKTTSGFPRTKEDSIKLFLPTYDAKLEMFNRSYLTGPVGPACRSTGSSRGDRATGTILQ